MASFIKQLNKVDDRTKCGVYGWVRKAEQELSLQHIPMMISSIIILYFRDDGIFDVIGDDIELSENKKVIRKIQNDQCWNNNSYGLAKIPSTRQISYKWDLKIKRCDGFKRFLSENFIVIGISSKQSPNKDFEHDQTAIHYAIVLHDKAMMIKSADADNWWDPYGNNDEEIEKLSMYLDLVNKQIKFSINDKDQGIAYKNIKVDANINYRLMISIKAMNNSVEILNFTTL